MNQSVYSALKPFRFPGQIEALAAGRRAAPVHVRIKPTNVCNHGCYFCAYRNDGLSLGEDMVLRDKIPPEKMFEIVDDLIAMGVKAVTFSGGGEPLIYPHLAEVVNRLGAAGIKVATLTNGSRLLGKVADALAVHATWVRVSIDGWDGPSYAAYRKVKETEFDQVMENLAAFAARRSRCALGASIIVDKTNARHVFELCGKLKACGVRHAKISPCILSNDGAANNAYHAPFRDVVRAEIGRARALDDADFKVVDHYHVMEESFSKCYATCPFSRMLTIIGADCNVYACQDKAYTKSGTLGSIKSRSFREFWFSDECDAALRAIDPRRTCRHHCVADEKNRALVDYLSIDPAHAAFV
ncbi:MAG TPA: radical SAM/SPASM domain-containing protein [Candidatus Cybelea sp.]|nr:radical SAM/SPASM domain-containing protein [Candidatus Cybelea sp.]